MPQSNQQLLPAIPPSPLLSAEEVAVMLRCHKVTLWRWLKTIPDFPQPIRKSPGRIAFYQQEVIDYIASRPRVSC